MPRITTAIQCIALIFAVSLYTKTPCSKPTPNVENIFLHSGAAMDMDEFTYLTDIKIGGACSEEQLTKAREILGMKKRFKNVLLTSHINPSTQKLIVCCTIEPNIILKRVKIRGILTNKTHYESLYNLQTGEVFSPSSHAASIKAIKEKLYTDGFLLGTVADVVSINQDTKTATVVITIDTGPRFFINHIKYSLNLPPNATQTTHENDIHEALKHVFNPLIHRYQYTQPMVRGWIKKVKRQLVERGFLNPKLHVKIVANKRTRKVTVVFVITITTPRFIITGNRSSSQSELLNALSSHVGQKWNLRPSSIKHQLKLHYQTKGYWKATIKIAQNDNNVLIEINEGTPLNISNIAIHTPHKKPLITPIMAVAKINPSTRCTNLLIREKLQRITKVAIKYGFWDCKIKGTKILIPKTNPTTCILDICVEPGDQRILKKIAILPTAKIPSIKATTHPEAYKNIPFDPQIITHVRRGLLSNLYQNGYWYASVECALVEGQKKDAEAGTQPLLMTYKIDPGEQVLFGKIITQGYSKLPFKQIVKNCQFPENALWDQKKIDSARSRLHHLGIFEHVQLTPYQLAQHKSPKHIIANILDDDPYEARLKIGIFASSDAPFLEETSSIRLAGTYLVKNPLNRADIFSITAQADSNEQLLSTQYTVPDLFGTNQLNSVLLITENHRYMLNLSEPVEAAVERRTSIRVCAYQPPALNEAQFGWSAGVDHSKLLSHYGNMNLDASLIEKSLFFLYFAPSYKKVSIDERKTMSEGSETFAELKFTFPIISHGNSPAIRCLFRQRFAKNLHKNIGIILTIRGGHLFSDGRFAAIHPNDRFYLGGADSVRGYSRDTLPPLGTYVTRSGTTGYTVQGGRSMLQASIELRNRISQNVEFQLFHDLGALAQSSLHELFTGRYRTIGMGTRLYTPVGTVKFDIGWKLNRSYAEEHSYNWHLSFDGSF